MNHHERGVLAASFEPLVFRHLRDAAPAMFLDELGTVSMHGLIPVLRCRGDGDLRVAVHSGRIEYLTKRRQLILSIDQHLATHPQNARIDPSNEGIR